MNRMTITAATSKPFTVSGSSYPTRRQAILSTIPLTAALTQQQRNIAAAATNPSPPVAAIDRYKILPDLEISRIIKGCWQLSGGHAGDRQTDRTSGKNAVEDCYTYFNNGITTFDTADIYGPSEKILGQYLANHPDAAASSQIFTKFCCFGNSMMQAKDENFVKNSIATSMKNIGVSSLDCVQFYWHDYSNKNYIPAALHLADLHSQGTIRSLGVTNFDVKRLQEIVDAGVDIKVNQVQYSVLDTRPDNGMINYCKDKGIVLCAYGTVAGGFLSDKYLGKDPKDIAINTYSLSKYASIINQRGGWEWFQSLLSTLHDIGRQYNVGVAEVASRWVLQRPTVAAVIVGARNAEHVDQHKRVFSFELSDDDLNRIQGVLDQGRRPSSDVYSFERGGAW